LLDSFWTKLQGLRMVFSRTRLTLAIFAVLLLAACDNDDSGAAPVVDANAILVVASDEPDELRERLIDSASDYLERIAGDPPGILRLAAPSSAAAIADVAAAAGAGLVLVLDAQELAPDRVPPAEIDALPNGGYRIATLDTGDFENTLAPGDRGATLVLLGGKSRLARQYSLYEALRRLGVRYYHPEEEFVPRVSAAQLRARATTPTAIARSDSPDYVPDFRFRGYTFHGAHPLEHLEAFSDGDFPIDEAENAIDWIVKNRGESFRGAGRGIASEEARARRVAELEEIRELLGMSRATGITLHNVQQGGRPQIDPSSPIPVRQQIETLVEETLARTPDTTQFGIHFGPTEVSVTPDVETVQWIDWAGQKALELRPDIPVIINNHTSGGQAVDNFDDLGCPPGTNSRGVCDYYDLAFHTDPRIGVSVHTVMLPPLEGPAFLYNQVTFAHKLCLMQRAAAAGRPLEWFPESSWWLSYDNPVPVYLPLYLATRHRDVELVAPLLEKNGGTLRRHKEFNSGHEWGYWQQDYGVGLWHWNVDVSFEAVLAEIADPLCAPDVWPQSCAARDEMVAVLGEVIDHQRELFLERTDFHGRPGLYPYFSGEDPAEELSERAGFTFHPQPPLTFAAVAALAAPEAERFQSTDLAALRAAAESYAAWAARLRAVAPDVPDAGQPWLAEVLDGVEINGLRAAHVAALFDGMLAFGAAQRAGDEDAAAAAQPFLDAAAAILGEAEQVIRRREAAYRYPAEQVYGGGLTPETAVANGTTYEYRVHTKTHLMTYWTIRQQRAEDVVAGEMQDPNQIVLAPVYADPGVPLDIGWPEIPGLVATVSLGDGTTVDPSVAQHAYDGEGVFPIGGTVEIDGTPIEVRGAVARATRRAASSLGALSLSFPTDPVAVEFIRGVSPAFYLAAAGTGFAVATDVTGTERFSFTDVAATTQSSDDDTFGSDPVDIRMQLVGLVGGDGTPRFIGLGDVRFSGDIDDGQFADSVNVTGTIAVQDVVDLLVELVGFDEQGALAFLANVYMLPVEELAADAPFEATLALE
jgi:hypothetical protein